MKKSCILFFLIYFSVLGILAQNNYEIDIHSTPYFIKTGHLQMGGSNSAGDSIAVNSRYIELNNKPIFPIVGEIHFSRYPHKYWDEAIIKMKAGGINIIATYVFWSMHEEIEGQFEWNADNDLRKFIELCAANEMRVILRIGPFCHGEIRNGGLPDWLLGKMLTIRSNDPKYLFYVDRLYAEIGKQIKGLLFKDNGPIFAIQLENEYQHSASAWGLSYPEQPLEYTAAERDQQITQNGVGVSMEKNPYAELGNEHILVLKSIAQKNGLEVPIYTVTGWGNSAVAENETLPVTAAYPYPSWSPIKLSNFYLYTDLQKKPDYSPVRYKPEDYPYFPAEIGGGIMGTYTRRPVIPARSLEALANRFIGSGANGLGYYMYHGGSTPKGKLFYFNDEVFGYPKISYDFQAPLSEYGKPVESLNRLKIYHYFLNDFANVLSPMQVILPKNVDDIKSTDPKALRYSVRTKDDAAFLFMNNFQDHQERFDIENVKFKVKLKNKDIQIPEIGGFTLAKDESAIFPVNINILGVHFNYATAQILTTGTDKQGEFIVFFAPEGVKSEFSISMQNGLKIKAKQCKVTSNKDRWLIKSSTNEPFEFKVVNKDKTVRVLVLDKHSALNSWIVKMDGETKILISESFVISDSNSIELISLNNPVIDFKLYPSINQTLSVNAGKLIKTSKQNELFNQYKLELPKAKLNFPVTHMGNKMEIDLSEGLPEGTTDLICRLNYKGDTGAAFINGELVADNFYNSVAWEIGLKRFFEKENAKSMVINFRPMYKNSKFLQDLSPKLIPVFDKSGKFLEIGEPEFIPEYSVNVSFKK